MSETISIQLSAELHRELEQLCQRENRAVGDAAREALRRYVAVERSRELRKEVLPYAEAQGIRTDEDVFKLIS